MHLICLPRTNDSASNRHASDTNQVSQWRGSGDGCCNRLRAVEWGSVSVGLLNGHIVAACNSSSMIIFQCSLSAVFVFYRFCSTGVVWFAQSTFLAWERRACVVHACLQSNWSVLSHSSVVCFISFCYYDCWQFVNFCTLRKEFKMYIAKIWIITTSNTFVVIGVRLAYIYNVSE